MAQLEPGTVTGWAAYPAGVAWSLREAGHRVAGADVLVDGDVPLGAGLSSSAALECSVALALTELSEIKVGRSELARIAQRAENQFVGVPSGIMDQSASLLARAGHALLLDTRSGEVRQIPLDLTGAGLALLVIDTNAPHRLVSGEYAARRRDCEQAAALLGVPALRDIDVKELDQALKRVGGRFSDPAPSAADAVASAGPGSARGASISDETAERLRKRVRHIVTENQRVLEVVHLLDDGRDTTQRTGSAERQAARSMRAGRWHESGPHWLAIGRLFTASHVSLRDDYAVSSPELDLAVDTALAGGALGARMTGGGFGGCAIILVPAGDADRVARAIADAFASRGFNTPRHFLAEASGGATKIFMHR